MANDRRTVDVITRAVDSEMKPLHRHFDALSGKVQTLVAENQYLREQLRMRDSSSSATTGYIRDESGKVIRMMTPADLSAAAAEYYKNRTQ